MFTTHNKLVIVHDTKNTINTLRVINCLQKNTSTDSIMN